MPTKTGVFFRSSLFRYGRWILLYLFEYVLLTNIMKKSVISSDVLSLLMFSVAVCLFFAVVWGIKEHYNVEKVAYIFIIGEITLTKINTKEVFEGLLNKPFWLFYVFVAVVIFARVFLPLKRIGEYLKSIKEGYKEARREEIDQRYQKKQIEQERRKQEKEQEEEYQRKKRELKKEEVKKNTQQKTNLDEGYSGALDDDNIQKNDEKQRGNTKVSSIRTKEDIIKEAKLNSILKISIVVFCVILPVLFILFYMISVYNQSSNNGIISTFLIKILEGNAVEKIESFLSISIALVAMYLILLVLFFIIWVVLVQILKSAYRMYSDLKESIINPGNHSNSSMAFYAFVILVIGIWFKNNSAMKVDDIGEQLINGDIIVFPIIIAIFIPIITLIMDFIDKANLDNLMKRDEAEKIKKMLSELVFGTLSAVLNYLKLITSDFLSSIQSLSQNDVDTLIEKKTKENENNKEKREEEQK